MGAAGVVSPLPGGTSEATLIGATCQVTLVFGSNGTVSATKTGSATWNQGPVAHNWFNGAPSTGIGNNFWVRATLNSGTLNGGTTGVWLQLSSDRTWNVLRSSAGTQTANLTLQIATDAAGANIVTSGTYVITANFDL